ncbi:hypothetical protein D3Z58_23905 [Clostridiaceae bacterium]|nr:hypothetical protein [Clostridiaceae bacterium]
MDNYNERQMTATSRHFNDVRACKIVQVDNEHLVFKLLWGNETAQIRPMDFEIGMYRVGEWIDMRLWTVSSQGRISLKRAQFIGKTPKRFVPKE